MSLTEKDINEWDSTNTYEVKFMGKGKTEKGINAGMGVGLGFIFAGIFTFNLHLFFTTDPLLIQKIFGVAFSLIGIGGMLLELGKGADKDYLQDVGVAIVIFVPVFIIFLAIEIVWLKIFFAILVNMSLIFVGVAFGKTFLSDEGSFKVDGRKLATTLIALLTIIGALISALNAFMENAPNLLGRFF